MAVVCGYWLSDSTGNHLLLERRPVKPRQASCTDTCKCLTCQQLKAQLAIEPNLAPTSLDRMVRRNQKAQAKRDAKKARKQAFRQRIADEH